MPKHDVTHWIENVQVENGSRSIAEHVKKKIGFLKKRLNPVEVVHDQERWRQCKKDDERRKVEWYSCSQEKKSFNPKQELASTLLKF